MELSTYLISTILFDWDGTLVDSAVSGFEAFRQAFRDLGMSIEYEVYEQVYSPNWYAMYETLRLPHDRWQKADELWMQRYSREQTALVEGARHTLNELDRRNYCLGIVTSGSHFRVKREIDDLGLTKIFGVVVCGEDIANRKPHPEGLETAMQRMNASPVACSYIGDCPEDIEMGKRAHLLTVGIPSPFPSSKRLLNANPDLYIESIVQLLEHFKGCKEKPACG